MKKHLLALTALTLVAVAPLSQAAYANPETAKTLVRAALSQETRTVTLGKSDTLARILERADVSADQREAVTSALAGSKLAPPRAGDRVSLTLAHDHGEVRLIALHYDIDAHADVTLVPREDGSAASVVTAKAGSRHASVDSSRRSVRGTSGADFTGTLADIGVPRTVVDEVRKALEFDPDMPNHPSAGTRFNLVYESDRTSTETANALHSVAITSADGREHRVYRYAVRRGLVAYVNPEGQGVVQLPQGEPVPGGKLTSPWGWRMHPVLKRPQFHKGVDFSAPAGTPVLATADGTVAFVGKHGNYGKLIRIQHGNEITTVYAHLQGFAHGLKTGATVKQGQTIGFVGRSGLATGNHLYYEVFANGQQVDPMASNAALPLHLSDNEMSRFKKYVSTEAAKPVE